MYEVICPKTIGAFVVVAALGVAPINVEAGPLRGSGGGPDGIAMPVAGRGGMGGGPMAGGMGGGTTGGGMGGGGMSGGMGMGGNAMRGGSGADMSSPGLGGPAGAGGSEARKTYHCVTPVGRCNYDIVGSLDSGTLCACPGGKGMGHIE